MGGFREGNSVACAAVVRRTTGSVPIAGAGVLGRLAAALPGDRVGRSGEETGVPGDGGGKSGDGSGGPAIDAGGSGDGEADARRARP